MSPPSPVPPGQTERYENPLEALRTLLEGFQEQIWTAIPAVVVSYNPTAGGNGTIVAQVAISDLYRDAAGTPSWVNPPPIPDIPVMFPSAGGFSLTFPIKPGDECLLVMACRNIDGWWASLTRPAVQMDLRMHHLSDAFALFGVKARGKPLPAISTTSVQLRTDTGTSYLEVTTAGAINLKAPGKAVTLTAGSVAVVAATLSATGAIAAVGPVTDTSAFTGAFLTGDGKTVTVIGGVIRSVV
jgi:hypothetical protein